MLKLTTVSITSGKMETIAIGLRDVFRLFLGAGCRLATLRIFGKIPVAYNL